MLDNNPSRLPRGKHLISIDPCAQQVTISGNMDPLVLSFEDACSLLSILYEHRETFSHAMPAQSEPFPVWAHPEVPRDAHTEPVRTGEAWPEQCLKSVSLEQRLAYREALGFPHFQ